MGLLRPGPECYAEGPLHDSQGRPFRRDAELIWPTFGQARESALGDYLEQSDMSQRRVTFADVARIVSGLPDVAEGERRGNRTWAVAGKTFAWERPFSKADIRRFGDVPPPDGSILAVRVEDLVEKEAVLAGQPDAFFTIPHFDGFAAVLIQLKRVTRRALREALIDGWLACAPRELADQFVRPRSPRSLTPKANASWPSARPARGPAQARGPRR